MKALFCLLIAGILTLSAYILELKNIREKYVTDSIFVARQMAIPVRALYQYAKDSGKQDPLNWVLPFYLPATGWKVSRAKESLGGNAEHYDVSFSQLTFTYSAVIDPAEKLRIKIQTHLSYLGFLGSQSPEMDILAVFLFFTITFLALLSMVSVFSKRRKNSGEELAKESNHIHAKFMQLTGCIKKLVQEIQYIVDAVSKSFEMMTSDYLRIMQLKDTLVQLESRLEKEMQTSPPTPQNIEAIRRVAKEVFQRTYLFLDTGVKSSKSVNEKHQEIHKISSRMNLALSDIKGILVSEIKTAKVPSDQTTGKPADNLEQNLPSRK